MSINRPFAYNPSKIPIEGFQQIGDLSVGTTDQIYAVDGGGLLWWGGPDEENGYIICASVPSMDRSTPIGNIGTVRFWRTKELTDDSILELVNILSNGTVTQISEIQNWLDVNEYWCSWFKELVTKYVKSFGSSISLDENGQIWGWGSNNYGQLGDNSSISKVTPVSIHGNKKTFCQITSGNSHTIGVDKNGQVWTWGYNYNGQLGVLQYITTPVKVSIL